MKFSQLFHFRKTELNAETLAAAQALGYTPDNGLLAFQNADNETVSQDEATHIKKESVQVELEIPSVSDLIADETGKGAKALELILDKVVTDIVRKDFDGGKQPARGWISGQVPEGYKFDIDYLLSNLVATASTGSSKSTVKMKDLRAMAEALNAWLVSIGKSANSANMQSGLVVEKYAGKVAAMVKAEMFPALKGNLVGFSETLNDDELELYGEALNATLDALELAEMSLQEVTADDL